MTGDDKIRRKIPDGLADTFAEDILNMSDADILIEYREAYGDPEIHAREMRALFEKAVLIANKRRLREAKLGAGASRIDDASNAVVDIAEARRLLRLVIETQTVPQELTLAARKESELTDSDVISMIEDLRELGVLPAHGDKDDPA